MPMLLRFNSICEKECLFYKLLKLLDKRGWSRLGLAAWIKSARLKHNGFQEVALRILVWNGIVAEVDHIKGAIHQELLYRGRLYRFILGKGDVKADAAYFQSTRCRRLCIRRDDLIELLPQKPVPLIVVDLTQLPEHNLDEASSLRRQLAATLGVIRQYLWDRHLLLTSAPAGTIGWLHSFIHSRFIRVTSLATDEALSIYGYTGKVILLDPSADKPLSREDVLEAEAFILGGIVDKRPRPGATARLPIERAQRRRIELRGSLIGVPNTINTLVDVILRARYIYDGNIERALYDIIPPHEARIRAYVEIARTASKKGCISWSFYEKLREWLPLRPRDFEKAARMAGVKICEREVSKDQFHHNAQR